MHKTFHASDAKAGLVTCLLFYQSKGSDKESICSSALYWLISFSNFTTASSCSDGVGESLSLELLMQRSRQLRCKVSLSSALEYQMFQVADKLTAPY